MRRNRRKLQKSLDLVGIGRIDAELRGEGRDPRTSVGPRVGDVVLAHRSALSVMTV